MRLLGRWHCLCSLGWASAPSHRLFRKLGFGKWFGARAPAKAAAASLWLGIFSAFGKQCLCHLVRANSLTLPPARFCGNCGLPMLSTQPGYYVVYFLHEPDETRARFQLVKINMTKVKSFVPPDGLCYRQGWKDRARLLLLTHYWCCFSIGPLITNEQEINGWKLFLVSSVSTVGSRLGSFQKWHAVLKPPVWC